MSRRRHIGIIGVLVLVGMAIAVAPAGAGHDDDPRTKNLHPMGHIEEPASLFYGPPNVHTDIAFWDDTAFQGSWLGINVRDISAPGNPKTISSVDCTGNQGDVIVWDDIVVRSWNSPARPGASCDGEPVPLGFEGLHVFDASDLSNLELIGSVELACGSHTATGVPDPDNGRLLVYNSGSSGACPGIDIVEVPLADPGAAAQVNFVGLARDCHDIGVILGDGMRAACAGDDGFAVLDLSGGDLAYPSVMYDRSIAPSEALGTVISIGHTAAFTFDAEVLIFGHEPGGGAAPRCQESDPEGNRSYFFFDTETGDLLGTWTLERFQSATENCTLHNLNVVPMRDGSYVLVHGSYQSGTAVLDFTDLSNPVEVAWSDPPAITPPDLGGAWSSYWYNNFIYETNITEGLNIFRYSGKVTAGAMRLDHLNPQTQMFTID